VEYMYIGNTDPFYEQFTSTIQFVVNSLANRKLEIFVSINY